MGTGRGDEFTHKGVGQGSVLAPLAVDALATSTIKDCYYGLLRGSFMMNYLVGIPFLQYANDMLFSSKKASWRRRGLSTCF